MNGTRFNCRCAEDEQNETLTYRFYRRAPSPDPDDTAWRQEPAEFQTLPEGLTWDLIPILDGDDDNFVGTEMPAEDRGLVIDLTSPEVEARHLGHVPGDNAPVMNFRPTGWNITAQPTTIPEAEDGVQYQDPPAPGSMSHPFVPGPHRTLRARLGPHRRLQNQ